ncbi:hypothetical protein N7495_009464 [Penicillium taxi]|uniref:uncharacterized protein n=1 Tax=Penicillium taxi TaxID=168475 RepID=UPI002544EBC0|nr:uncharacterized protein N7495_009464 [Penicillium taxi]KAJ5884954.1 hypothetical protein N7495_009464 [Penicillium taxi]
MSSFNPFRAKSLDGSSATATVSAPQTVDVPDLFTKPIQPISYPRKAALSLEIESEDSTSSDEQTTNPFNPDSAGNEDLDNMISPRSSDSLDGLPRRALAAPPAPSMEGSSTPSTASTVQIEQRPSIARPPSIRENIHSSKPRQISSESTKGTSPSGRSIKDKKPPPPPRSHHGKPISVAGNIDPPSRPSSSRLSFHASSPEILTSRTPNTAYTSSQADYFSVSTENPALDSTESLSRSRSQHKRPPTPPLSRRYSQMHRSKSTQSKSSVTRLPYASQDSESNYSSQPPSPGLSTRSVGSTYSQKHKHLSLPPLSLGDTVTSSPASYVDTISPPIIRKPVHTRRTSSHGSLLNGSSGAPPPPPPPPRRARDSNSRNGGDGDSVPQKGAGAGVSAEMPSPLSKASNANDILADLSRLQKEVDDLRGHYENRKLSE